MVLKSKKILLVTYGLCRGAGVSKENYRTTIIDPLESYNCEIDCIHIIKNEVSNKDAELEPMKFTTRDRAYFASEEALSDNDLYEYSKKFHDKHSDNYLSNRYLINQLSKLYMATKLRNFYDYEAIILVRDDLCFEERPINWRLILYLINFGPVVSKWFWNGGASERFVAATPEDAYKIATRKQFAAESIKLFGCLNGEYLQKFIFDYYKMRPLALSLRFCRVRKGRKLYKERYIYPIWRPRECCHVIISMTRVMRLKIYFYFGLGTRKI